MMPPQVVERRCIVGVNERLDRHGVVLTPLDPEEVVAAATTLVEREQIEALAVSFLWSFRNPIHEEQAVGALDRRVPRPRGHVGRGVASRHPRVRALHVRVAERVHVGRAHRRRAAGRGARPPWPAGAGAAGALRRRVDHHRRSAAHAHQPRGVGPRGGCRGRGRGRPRRERHGRGHLRHGRHVVRRVGRQRRPGDAPRAWRPHGDLDRVVARRRRLHRRGRRLGRLDRRARDAAGRAALGRRGARARVLRARRRRADRHRRAARARLPRARSLPRRRHGPRRRRRVGRVRTSRHDAVALDRGSGVGHPRDRAGRHGQGRPRQARRTRPRPARPRARQLRRVWRALRRRHRAGDRHGHRGRPRARVGAVGVRRRDRRRAA